MRPAPVKDEKRARIGAIHLHLCPEYFLDIYTLMRPRTCILSDILIKREGLCRYSSKIPLARLSRSEQRELKQYAACACLSRDT